MTVGNGAEADMEAIFGEQGSIALARTWFGFMSPSELGIEPESNIEAAAEVVEAIVMAAGGRGWL